MPVTCYPPVLSVFPVACVPDVMKRAVAPQGITFQPDIYPKVISILPSGSRLKVLDVGAGEGYFTQMLKEAGHDVEACDVRPDEYSAEAPFHSANLNESIPLASESFDCVVSIEVIEHIENHPNFVNELFRVTRKGGTVIITTPNILNISSRWYFFATGYDDCAPRPVVAMREDYELQHINPIGLPRLMLLIERAGGEMVELHTNRLRKSAWLPMMLMYPFFAFSIRRALLGKKYADQRQLHERHIHWMLKRENLMGRITIAVARRVK